MCVFQLKGHITPVRTLAFSPDGLALASGGVGGLMNIWSLRVRHTHTQDTHSVTAAGSCHTETWKEQRSPPSHSSCTALLFTVTLTRCARVCPRSPGRLGAPDGRGRVRGDPEHRLDPRCGCRRLLQQVEGKTSQLHSCVSGIHSNTCVYLLSGLFRVCVCVCVCSYGFISRMCWL